MSIFRKASADKEHICSNCKNWWPSKKLHRIGNQWLCDKCYLDKTIQSDKTKTSSIHNLMKRIAHVADQFDSQNKIKEANILDKILIKISGIEDEGGFSGSNDEIMPGIMRGLNNDPIGGNPIEETNEDYFRKMNGDIKSLFEAGKQMGIVVMDSAGNYVIEHRENMGGFHRVNKLIFSPNDNKLYREHSQEAENYKTKALFKTQSQTSEIDTTSPRALEITKNDLANAGKKRDEELKDQDTKMSGALDRIIEVDQWHSSALNRMIINDSSPDFDQLWDDQSALQNIHGNDTEAIKDMFGGSYKRITPVMREQMGINGPGKGSVWYVKGENGMPELYRANYDSSD